MHEIPSTTILTIEIVSCKSLLIECVLNTRLCVHLHMFIECIIVFGRGAAGKPEINVAIASSKWQILPADVTLLHYVYGKKHRLLSRFIRIIWHLLFYYHIEGRTLFTNSLHNITPTPSPLYARVISERSPRRKKSRKQKKTFSKSWKSKSRRESKIPSIHSME